MSDPLDDLARGLRRDLGGELRAEAEAGEADAAMALHRGRRLSDVAAALVDRGSEVAVGLDGRTLRGTAVGAGRDVVVLEVDRDLVAVALAHVRTLAEFAAPPSASARRLEPGSWRTWLLGLEWRAGVELALAGDPMPAPGVVEVVAVDHLHWRTPAGTTHVAIDAVAVAVTRG